MQSRTLTLMVIALACGLGAAYLAWKYAGGGADKNVVMKKVLVPKEDIKGLTRLNIQELFHEKEVKESSLRDVNDVVTTFDEVKDMRNKDFTLSKDMPIYKSDLVKYRESSIISRLKEGERAVTVPVDAAMAGSGHIEIGSRVDIITQIPTTGADQKVRFKVVFQNIEVLGVNTDSAPSPDGQPKPANTLTLRMKNEDAPAMTAYRTRGQTFHVVLRNPGDDKIYDYKEFVLGDEKTGAGESDQPKEVAITDPPVQAPPPVVQPSVPTPVETKPEVTPVETKPAVVEIDNEPKWITTRIVGDGPTVKTIKTEIKKEEKKPEKSEEPAGSSH